jgi:hypothetical protein
MVEPLSANGTHNPDLPLDGRERTILTTDIVGSTALLRRYPNDMLAARICTTGFCTPPSAATVVIPSEAPATACWRSLIVRSRP